MVAVLPLRKKTNNMNIRRFNDSDYEMVCSWWKQHEWPSIPLDFLPKVGIIIDDCAAGFLYSTDSKICWLEFIVVDPRSDKAKRRAALDTLISSASEIAKEMGHSVIFTSASHEGLISRYINDGFQITDKTMTNLMRIL